MIVTRRTRKLIALFVSALLPVGSGMNACAQAQILQDFEKDATQHRESSTPPPAQPSRSSDSHRSSYDWYRNNEEDEEEGFFDGLMKITLVGIGTGMLAGGVHSWQCVTLPVSDPNAPPQGFTPRSIGEPLIPFLRIDASYQGIERYIDAWDYRVQAGYGPFALEYTDSRYREKSPEASMNVRRGAFLYRMTAGDFLEIDLGLGTVQLDGVSRRDAFAFSLPILVYPKETLGLEFRPAWARFNGSRFNEYDLAACVNFRGMGVKAGYRWLVTPNSRLDGPYAGFVLRF